MNKTYESGDYEIFSDGPLPTPDYTDEQESRDMEDWYNQKEEKEKCANLNFPS